jgi:uncharacterized repeat protein (TIGR03806 family)
MSRGALLTAIGLIAVMVLFILGCEQHSEDTGNVDRAAVVTPDSGSSAETKTVPKAPITIKPPPSSITIDVDARRPAKKLSDYHLFDDLAEVVPAAGVVPYSLNAVSFVDHARQENLLYLPPGEAAEYQPDNALSFPVGTVLIQHIRFPIDERDDSKGARLVETRLLIHMARGWTAVPYVWNAEGTDADRAVIGVKTDVTVTQPDGEPHSFTYLTPNMNECKRCHVNENVMYPLGVTAANLNRNVEVGGNEINQLVYWQQQGVLTGLPEEIADVPQIPDWRESSAATVERRARSWLDVNCSHCHNPRGAASTSGLDLTFQQDQPVRFGVFKPPVAAGRGSQGLKFSIVPQRPDESFLVRRIDSTELGVMMPPLGRSTVHHAGVELIRQWITEMEVDEALAEAARNPMKAYKEAADGKGSAEIGREIFHKRQKCITCHRVGNEGGTVGPNLSDVGKRTRRDYLLESIVVPGVKIVKGFETLAIVLIDGRVVTGTVQFEDESEIVIADAKNQTRIQKDNIDERIESDVSTMPTLANLLSVDDVRHLIAYLETLQETPND